MRRSTTWVASSGVRARATVHGLSARHLEGVLRVNASKAKTVGDIGVLASADGHERLADRSAKRVQPMAPRIARAVGDGPTRCLEASKCSIPVTEQRAILQYCSNPEYPCNVDPNPSVVPSVTDPPSDLRVGGAVDGASSRVGLAWSGAGWGGGPMSGEGGVKWAWS